MMNDTKHGKGDSPFPDDLERNPGIGQSKGSFATGVPPDAIEGENTPKATSRTTPPQTRACRRKNANVRIRNCP